MSTAENNKRSEKDEAAPQLPAKAAVAAVKGDKLQLELNELRTIVAEQRAQLTKLLPKNKQRPAQRNEARSKTGGASKQRPASTTTGSLSTDNTDKRTIQVRAAPKQAKHNTLVADSVAKSLAHDQGQIDALREIVAAQGEELREATANREKAAKEKEERDMRQRAYDDRVALAIQKLHLRSQIDPRHSFFYVLWILLAIVWSSAVWAGIWTVELLSLLAIVPSAFVVMGLLFMLIVRVGYRDRAGVRCTLVHEWEDPLGIDRRHDAARCVEIRTHDPKYATVEFYRSQGPWKMLKSELHVVSVELLTQILCGNMTLAEDFKEAEARANRVAMATHTANHDRGWAVTGEHVPYNTVRLALWYWYDARRQAALMDPVPCGPFQSRSAQNRDGYSHMGIENRKSSFHQSQNTRTVQASPSWGAYLATGVLLSVYLLVFMLMVPDCLPLINTIWRPLLRAYSGE